MKADIEKLKKLREETGAGIADCREALESSNNDMEQARVWIGKKGIQRADKKAEREIKVGWVFSYVHHNGRVGSMIVVGCETDFVAKTEDFQKLGRELAAQVAAVMPESREELLESEYFRQPSKKVSELIKEVVGKLGENIQVGEFKVVGV